MPRSNTENTKGDILVETGQGQERLPVGSDNQVVTADSTDAKGAAWAGSGGNDASIRIRNPRAGDVWHLKYFRNAATLQRCRYICENGVSVAFNMEERSSSTPWTAGTDVFVVDASATTTITTTATFNNAGMAADTDLVVTITSVTGEVTELAIYLEAL